MVPASRKKSCKIFFCLGKIVFFYSEFFASENHYWNYWKPILKKNFITPSRNWFSGEWKTVFSIFQIFLAVKTVFSPRGNIFFNEFFIPASGNGFLSSGNSIPLFKAWSFVEVFEIWGWQFFKGNLIRFFLFSERRKREIRLVERYF